MSLAPLGIKSVFVFLWHFLITLIAPVLTQYIYKNSFIESIAVLHTLVSGKRVVVIGSGSSVEHLPKLPNDVVVLACNFSPKFVPTDQDIAGYITTKFAYRGSPDIKELLHGRLFSWVGIDKLSLAPKSSTSYRHTALYVKPYNPVVNTSELLRKRLFKFFEGQFYWFSSGMQLILLALLAGAREVFVIGIDTGPIVTYSGNFKYKKDPAIKENRHLWADSYALSELQKKNEPVYALDGRSPVCHWLRVKSLQDE